MKNLSITILCMAFAINAMSQIEKGTSAIGVQLSGNFSNSNNDNTFQKRRTVSWQLISDARYEYFIKQNLSIGGGLNYAINQTSTTTNPTTSNTFETKIRTTLETYGLHFQVSKYWFIHPKVGFHLTPRIGSFYNETTNYNRIDNPAISESNRVQRTYRSSWHHLAQVNAGICLFLHPNISVNTSIEVAQFRYTNSAQNLRMLNTNPIFSFGATYFLRKKS